MNSILAHNTTALASPVLMTNTSGHAPAPMDGQVPTVATGGHQALVSAFLAKHFTGVVGQGADKPAGTVTTVDHHSLVAAHIERQFSASKGNAADAPLGCSTAGGGGKSALVASFLTKYYGQGCGQSLDDPSATATTKDRMGLVTVNIQGVPYVIVDIGMRMLSPRELYRAQGFPDSYKIDIEVDGKPLSKAAKVRLCGNSVCPDVAAVLVRANCVVEERAPVLAAQGGTA